ncbi:MAG: hypothetical protein PVJ41_10275 [Desulfobacterales bacterium]|jgi:hypothetical protein
MLTKLTDTISFSLLPLFSALFIAVGMPLLHPALHSHSENYDIISEHYDEHSSTFADEDHELNCTICDFLATSQLYDAGMEPIIAENKPTDKIASIKNTFLARTHPMQIEPRAPPIRNSL